MGRSLKVFGIAAVLSPLTALVLSSTATAQTAHPQMFAVSLHGVRPGLIPNTDIVVKNGTTKFKPKRLTVLYTGTSSTTSPCTSTTYSFTATNKTASTQQLTFIGAPLVNPIPAGQTEGVCFWGHGSGTLKVGLTSSPNVLKLHIS